MFLSCILKKPDVDDDDLCEDDNQLKQDEEFLSRSERDIQGRPAVLLSCWFSVWCCILHLTTSETHFASNVLVLSTSLDGRRQRGQKGDSCPRALAFAFAPWLPGCFPQEKF